jgi:DNA-binding GntR family transcriptional regulator
VSAVGVLRPDDRQNDRVTQSIPRSGAGTRIAAELRQAILDGQYAPGARVRQEDLAGQHGASRLPVREALRILESEGLVTLVANTGAWVSQLSLTECQEMYQIRERIEPLLLRYSIPNLSPEQVDRLEALADAMESSSDVEQFLRLDREFHLTSYTAADTTVLAEMVEQLWNRTQHYRRAFTRVFRSVGDRSAHHDHHLMVHAIRRDDLDEAERVLHDHIRRTRLELARHPDVFEN